MADSPSRSERFGAFPSLSARLDNLDGRVTLGGLGGLIAPTFSQVMGSGEDSYVLTATDGVVGGAGTVVLPDMPGGEGDARAFIISAYMESIEVIPGEGSLIFDLSNNVVGSVTVEANSVITLLRYTGVWRVIDSSEGIPGPLATGVPVASVVLYCPTLTPEDLTPTDGDTMYWVEFTPGLAETDPMTGLNDWTGREEFSYNAGWAALNDPTNVLMMVGDDTWRPSILAEVTLTGFEQILVLGGQPILVGCGGGAGGLSNATWWSGFNTGDGNIGSSVDPTALAIYILPVGTNADNVFITDRSGSSGPLSEWVADNTTTYYEASLGNLQPWVQSGAVLTAEGYTVGHVTQTSTWVADATIRFRSTVTVDTPGTGAPLFLVRQMFRSLDPDGFSGWQWGWGDLEYQAQVHGVIGGLPFVGFVERDGNLLDADGATVSRVLQTGDNLYGTITGVFQND